jgi:CDP-paratose 2-epimerase
VKILISGVCGFVGSSLAAGLRAADPSLEVCGFDNFIRPGSETNRLQLRALGISVRHADVRSASDMAALPDADWVLDAAALPSVLAGVDGRSSSRQLVEHNLGGTIHLLEYCRERRAGFLLLSTSRVYSIAPLAALPLRIEHGAFVPEATQPLPAGASPAGIGENFSTTPPLSLYGSTKAASETLALEYGSTFGFPVWVNRCGVLAGAGQFGQAEQGIFSYWIHAWAAKKPLRYIGFAGTGAQTRDALHPRDLLPLLRAQMAAGMPAGRPQVVNAAGGASHSMSLAQLSAWCRERFGPREVAVDAQPRPFDVPWLVLDRGLAAQTWNWRPATPLLDILDEIARHATEHPEWLALSQP